jgi:hypothetical protein
MKRGVLSSMHGERADRGKPSRVTTQHDVEATERTSGLGKTLV